QFSLNGDAANTSLKVISLLPTDTSAITNVTIKNAVFTGQSTHNAINTYAGIYHGNYSPAGLSPSASPIVGRNHNITIENNLVQAVRNGIYIRGAAIAGTQNRNWNNTKNTIGGTVPPGTMGSPKTTYV